MAAINEKIICAGFGGQGIMVMGKVIAEAAMLKGLNVTWLPAYGAEVRGGTAFSMVRVSDEFIANPVVGRASTAILMNDPSFHKFRALVEPGGLMVVNTSLVAGDLSAGKTAMAAYSITEEAIKIGNIKVANIIAVGIYAGKKKIFDKKVLKEVIKIMAGGRKELVPINFRALDKGMELSEK
ncbi:MAG: 2-oxoacid:acceptor oxidoreductase family protein [Candidatus Omnitrophota bacterium]